MRLEDPTATSPKQNYQIAPRLPELNQLRVGLLCNGKANARPLLQKTAALFALHHECAIDNEMAFKANASAPAEDGVIEALAERSDFLLTANGD